MVSHSSHLWLTVRRLATLLIVGIAFLALNAGAGDAPMWGQWPTRNMVSDEVGLPDTVDVANGDNVKWTVPLGTKTYASPIIAGSRIYIGTNNGRPRAPEHQGDRGILLCLNETDGSLRWQLAVPKLPGDKYLDWPQVGICSPPTVEGNRVYVVSNRGEILCLDTAGLANGNDGPFDQEAVHAAPEGKQPVALSKQDADIVWLFDMQRDAGTYCHDSAHSSILIDGRYLYLNTGTGVDNTHRKIRRPDAPCLIVLDKLTGRLVAREQEGLGSVTFHCTWSSPAIGDVGGNRLLFYGGPDGVCYAFNTLPRALSEGAVQALEKVWRFDCDPTAPKSDVHTFIGNRQEGPTTIYGMPVFQEGAVYVAAGGDMWWGKRQSWLKRIDAGGSGDVTGSAETWSYPISGHISATPAVHKGLVYVADCNRTLHCVDAQTGKAVWTHKTQGPVWGSVLVADGKLYLGTRGKQFLILAADREKEVLSSTVLDGPVSGTAAAANGTVYVTTMRTLYAFAKAQ
ncbi:MAG: PQQ-binding-like beta-propeller repeat protein [Lentisphaerae bacterium]|jgi:outer membrane protein assembly factor BamB|nr:PQQ-binding-like beta-propeller repeat protein [Lentisphaerota bacterium]MBT5605724.1 PQQ-binding-like beta-propeller repeat protein [Lentisphaerota bacterium]MBT7061954.1 PQQ-binding-like beta-propeller repeat protein [Lentisphaerota bacterium]MBT7842549.1 PQQ-binding-like beta-propeller repeat protein [Lentisphaerota bacterium]